MCSCKIGISAIHGGQMAEYKSNFNFLAEHWTFLLDDARQVEGYALRDPRAAAIFARRTLTLKRSLKWLFANDTALKAPYEKSLAAMNRNGS